jgi:clan AA aspartic protease
MGIVYETITLKNTADVLDAERGLIKDHEVRAATVRALVDTGTGTLVISEEIREKLGLRISGLKEVTLGNERKEICKRTEPVNIHWKDRDTTCRAIVASGWGETLLGAIPLEDMDLMVNPVKQELVGAHGDKIVYLLK